MWTSAKRRLPASRTRTAWKSMTPARRWRSSTAVIAARASADGAMSMSPATESLISVNPVHMMFRPAPSATTASSTGEWKTATRPTPTRTAAEVTTSVARCLASATRVVEFSRRPLRYRTRAAAPLTREATTDTARPRPSRSGMTGEMRRSIAEKMMKAAATKIMVPSTIAEKYSALEWPNWWSSSAGRIEIFRTTRAMTAATRLTTDSAASESRPTEPVIHAAHPLRAMVARAAPMDSQA